MAGRDHNNYRSHGCYQLLTILFNVYEHFKILVTFLHLKNLTSVFLHVP